MICKTGLVFLGAPLLAGQFDPMIAVYKANRPEAKSLAVVCDYVNSRDAIDDLARSSEVERILVLDVHNLDQVGAAVSYLDRHRPDAMVLLPNDRIVRDGSAGATRVIRRMALNSVPTMATTPVALKQGAWFAIGEATHGELLVNPAIKGDVKVLLPGDKLASDTRASVKVVSWP
jgi:hypothetical protein